MKLKDNSFHYCAYWHSWSRILRQDGMNISEINLISHTRTVEECRNVWVRQHCTAPSRGDLFSAELPDNIRGMMVDRYGEADTVRLLTEDFYSKIDWEKYRKTCNGGAALEKILL